MSTRKLVNGLRPIYLRNPALTGGQNRLSEIGTGRTAVSPEQTGLRNPYYTNQIRYQLRYNFPTVSADNRTGVIRRHQPDRCVARKHVLRR